MATAATRDTKEQKYGVKWEAHNLLGGKCAECQEPFGILSIRRHCRRCGHIVCSSCQHPERVVVPGSNNPKIVCKPCGSLPSTAEALAESEGTKEAPAATGEPCTLCGEPLGDEAIIITDEDSPLKGRIHVDCFVCCIDGEPIDGSFAEVKGKLFCEEHYKEFMCESCGGCGQKIVEGAVVKALGAQWHAECFVCACCCKPLGVKGEDEESAFNFHLHNGAVYCERDYLEHFCKKCNGCGFPVDLGLRASDATWHRECFVCYECRQPFADMEECTFAMIDGRPFCPKDAEAIGRLRPEDRSLLQTLPRAATAGLTVADALTPSPEDCGGCLSRGLAEALIALPAPKGDLQPSAFKQRPQWSLSGGEGRSIPFEFAVWAPEVFALLRKEVLGIQPEDYKSSLCLRPLAGGRKGEGKSGMLFYFSWDYRYIVKTCSHEEMPFFMQCLQDYYTYLAGEPRIGSCTASFLPRYLGLYSAKFEGQPALNFVVMNNVFPPRVDLQEQYDLKGVLGMKRFVSEEDAAKGTKVLKDRNFAQRAKLAVGSELKAKLEEQLRRDVAFLQQHDRMDYSLLLGIATADSLEGPGHSWPAADSHGLRSCGGTGQEVYFMGVIDILQEYNWRKALEGNLKTAGFRALHMGKRASLRTADNVVSAASPSHYASRFLDFLVSRME